MHHNINTRKIRSHHVFVFDRHYNLDLKHLPKPQGSVASLWKYWEAVEPSGQKLGLRSTTLKRVLQLGPLLSLWISE